jgi:hypothetical protein
MEDTMPDTAKNDKAGTEKKNAPKNARKESAYAGEINPKHKIGLVEILIFLLVAGVVFIFIFGMNQMKKEKAQELALQQKFEQVLPNFALITKAAKEYQANDPFAAWPLSIEELNLPQNINTPEFKFSFMENGVVVLTTTKEFGKEGIVVNYDIAKDSYSVEDPSPETKPTIKEDWIQQ